MEVEVEVETEAHAAVDLEMGWVVGLVVREEEKVAPRVDHGDLAAKEVDAGEVDVVWVVAVALVLVMEVAATGLEMMATDDRGEEAVKEVVATAAAQAVLRAVEVKVSVARAMVAKAMVVVAARAQGTAVVRLEVAAMVVAARVAVNRVVATMEVAMRAAKEA